MARPDEVYMSKTLPPFTVQARYDFFVIGGGSGGVRASRWAAARGLKVGIAEGARYGGTCVNVGCVPKKLYYHAVQCLGALHDAEGFGWSVPTRVSHDWGTLRRNVDRYILRLNGIYEGMLDQTGVSRYQGWARFLDPHHVAISLCSGEGDQLEEVIVYADHILIAPGSQAVLPEISGAELIDTSDRFFALDAQPRSAVVIGAGYIGVELACALKGLGVETTLVTRGDLPLRGFDQDLRTRLDKVLRSGLTVHSGVMLTRVEQGEAGLKDVYLSDRDEPLRAEFVLAAIGRRPATHRLNLEVIGMALREGDGAIQVDSTYRTSHPHIFAVGDVINRAQLTPVALAEAMRVVAQLTGESLPPLDYDLVPTTVFTHPNVGTVGLSEEAARAQGYAVTIFETDFKPLHQALSSSPRRVYMKLVVCSVSDRVLGCHMIGDEAGEQIQGLAAAMQASITKTQLDQTIGIHPTMAEEWVTMRTPRADF